MGESRALPSTKNCCKQWLYRPAVNQRGEVRVPIGDRNFFSAPNIIVASEAPEVFASRTIDRSAFIVSFTFHRTCVAIRYPGAGERNARTNVRRSDSNRFVRAPNKMNAPEGSGIASPDYARRERAFRRIPRYSRPRPLRIGLIGTFLSALRTVALHWLTRPIASHESHSVGGLGRAARLPHR